METKRSCTHLALISLKLTKASANIFKEAFRGGTLESKFASETQTAEGKIVDHERPGRFELTVNIAGMERKDSDTESPSEKAFEVMVTMVGIFQPKKGVSFTEDEFSDCYAWLSAQVYLPLREYCLNTLGQMGVQITLPLTIPKK